jgi:hypothetical protein
MELANPKLLAKLLATLVLIMFETLLVKLI